MKLAKAFVSLICIAVLCHAVGCGPAPAPVVEEYGDAAEQAKEQNSAPKMTPSEGI